jgi:alpha-ketoglutarate-dependent taurine dioxygenase
VVHANEHHQRQLKIKDLEVLRRSRNEGEMTISLNSIVRQPLTERIGEVWSGTSDLSLADLPASAVARAFRDNGAILFRGFGVDKSAFKAFTDVLCPNFMTYEGGASARQNVNGEDTLLTVTEPSMLHGIPLHGEMYYTSLKPYVLFFYCERPAAENGETTVADGAALYRDLKPETRKYFTDHKIKYVCTYPDGRWQQLFQTESASDVESYCRENNLLFHLQNDNSVVTEYVASAIAQPFYFDEPAFINNIFTMVRWEQAGFDIRVVRDENGERLPGAIIDELQELEIRHTYPVSWQPGDVLMVDNSRLLHGRYAFEDKERTILVRLGDRLPDSL